MPLSLGQPRRVPRRRIVDRRRRLPVHGVVSVPQSMHRSGIVPPVSVRVICVVGTIARQRSGRTKSGGTAPRHGIGLRRTVAHALFRVVMDLGMGSNRVRADALVIRPCFRSGHIAPDRVP